MEKELKELVNRFGGYYFLKNGKVYCAIPSEYSISFGTHFKSIFPDKELTFIYFDGKFDMWRVDKKGYKI